MLTVSLALGFVRLNLGPDVPNRTVAFDLITLHAVGMVALIAIRHNAPMLLDIALVAAVLGFLGTMLLARYIEESDEK
ncbi:MAG: pesticidal protein Cry22Aa [Anaerolineales bacterium]|nr:pesticidal protein Cry22Aa [Anaerolineales bacterium]